MKSRLLIGCLGLTLALTAQGGIIYRVGGSVVDHTSINANIPDGSAVGWGGTATLNDYRPSISDVSVNLNISGGYNGDLYAYLSYGGVLVPLLNRVGVTGTGSGNAFGYGDAGMNVSLSDHTSTDVHFYGALASPNTYQPDGRYQVDPLTSNPASFDGASRRAFSAFDGMNPNGTWTIFFADLSTGAQSQLLGWSLEVTAVPEPINVALGIFGVVFGAVTLGRSRQVRSLLRRAEAN